MNSYNVKRYILENKGKCLQAAAVVIVVLAALIICLNNYLTKDSEMVIVSMADDEIAVETPEINMLKEETYIIVDIQGAVNNPGVVSLPDGSRVNDAIEKAGGLTEKADTMNVNLATRLADGDKVYIPKEQEQTSVQKSNSEMAGVVTNALANKSAISSSNAGEGDGTVNINTANSERLQTLSGVGPATAQKIIDYRERSGGFKKVEDIMKVSGIGVKTFEKLKDKISV